MVRYQTLCFLTPNLERYAESGFGCLIPTLSCQQCGRCSVGTLSNSRGESMQGRANLFTTLRWLEKVLSSRYSWRDEVAASAGGSQC
jgi:hypothetical protein